MGGFQVHVDGGEVPFNAWGSRRARQLCKRLAVAVGQPVTRDELVDLLWPDDPQLDRLSARLSVVLSMVRRVLPSALITDRAAVRLDLTTVGLDVAALYEALDKGDDGRAVDLYRGELLPEDRYEDWVVSAADRLRLAVVGAWRRLASSAEAAGHHDAAAEHAARLLDLDPFDERGHELVVRSLMLDGRTADARRAELHYRRAMEELGVSPARCSLISPTRPAASKGDLKDAGARSGP